MHPFEPETFESRGRRNFIVPLLFLILSGTLLILPMPLQQQVSGALRSSVLAPFIWVQESLHQARVRATDVAQMQAQLDSTVAVLMAQQTLLEENVRLRALLELRSRTGAGFLSASAIHPGTRGSESMFLLDVGAEDGVGVNDPVVVSDGLVGVVREVSARTSLAMDWTHPDFRVSVMTEDGEVFGIVEPRHGAFREEDRLLLNGVPYHTPVEDGMAVLTSGRGSVYPRGIMVGTVSGLAETEAGWRRSYWLEPAVRPGSATHVLVFTGPPAEPDGTLEYLWFPGAGPVTEMEEGDETTDDALESSDGGVESPDLDP